MLVMLCKAFPDFGGMVHITKVNVTMNSNACLQVPISCFVH